MSQLGARLHEIPKDRPVLVLCASGTRSSNVTAHLVGSGWEDVGNIAGGISTWERMGLPGRGAARSSPARASSPADRRRPAATAARESKRPPGEPAAVIVSGRPRSAAAAEPVATRARALAGWLYRYPMTIRMMKLTAPTVAALR